MSLVSQASSAKYIADVYFTIREINRELRLHPDPTVKDMLVRAKSYTDEGELDTARGYLVRAARMVGHGQ